jgi:hypothetical protein
VKGSHDGRAADGGDGGRGRSSGEKTEHLPDVNTRESRHQLAG